MQNLQNGAYEEAVRLLLLSANQGFPLAQLELADCYADGYGVAINPIEAFSWYYKAACSGNPDAQYEVAVCYEQGNGIDRNLQKAVEWYQNSDSKNVKRVLKDSCRKHLNLLLQVEQDNDYLQVK